MRSEVSMQAIEPVLARPKTAHLLVIGFKAWAVPEEPASELALREQLAPSSTRAVWDLKGRPDARLAVTATEHATVRDALCALSEELGCNQLAALPRGPEEIGEISFMHPREEPPAIFFVTANLTVGVFSFGREFVDVVPFARRIDADLRSVPPEAREGGIAVEQVQNQIHATPRWRGPDGYLKVVAPGSELSKKGETVDGVTGDADVYYIEPGRETYHVTVRRG